MDETNFKTLGTRLSVHEADLVEVYCKRKGITPSKFIRDILLKQIEIVVPNNVAGNNILKYNKEFDTFSWSVKLDNGEISEVIENMSPEYLEDLQTVVSEVISQRNAIINKKKVQSVPIPAKLKFQ